MRHTYTDFAPPIVNISLDEPPKERWAPLMKVIDMNYFREILPQIINSVVPERLQTHIKTVVKAFENYKPQQYAVEIEGLACLSGVNITELILLNFAYEITAYCTSIVAQDTNGHIYHGRNLDNPFNNNSVPSSFVKVARKLTVDIQFIRDGKVAYRGSSFAGYVGLWTGQSANKFTITGNQRDNGSKSENLILAFIQKIKPASWLMRETLEEAANYQDALERLSRVPIITPIYYIVAGVQPGEGAVVTRDHSRAADVWKLDPPHGQWFRVQSNYDHWEPPPDTDKHSIPTIKTLNATGQENINLDSIFKVLTAYPACDETTIYTTVMSAGTPEKYRTVVREECSNWTGIITAIIIIIIIVVCLFFWCKYRSRFCQGNCECLGV